MPRVSVVLPVFNAARYVREAVSSILNQTFTDFEFVIVDDGSTDASAKILRSFAAKDDRIRLISRPNTGCVPALQEAIALCRGEYLARMDADDIAHCDRLAQQVAFLDRHPEVVVLGTSYKIIDSAGRLLRNQHQPMDDASLQRRCLAGTTPICHPTAIFRRSAYDRVGGYDASYAPAEDLDLWLRFGENGKLACLPELLLQYRIHRASVSHRQQLAQIEAARRACLAAAIRRGVAPSFTASNGWRAASGREGRFTETLKFGWWAFNSGERRTTLAYGIRAVFQRPGSVRAWKLLFCSCFRTGSGLVEKSTV